MYRKNHRIKGYTLIADYPEAIKDRSVHLNHRMAWVKEDEIISISKIRNERLNELGV